MIDIKELEFRYKAGEPLFSDLDLNISPGSICGLLGKNGAGKTTLLRLICGLLFPQGGHCEVFGQKPKERQPEFLEKVYFIPEEFYVPPISVTAYLKIYATFYPKFDRQSFDNWLQEFELPQNKNLTEMSYGQKKKFLAAFGIATNCDLLILDEPTNGLDIPSKSQFRKMLAKAITDEKTFIISTHQVRDIENLIDPIIILDSGKIILNQTVESITNKLAFETNLTGEDLQQALYSEKVFNGIHAVTINTEKLESNVNLEMLFNAAILNKDRLSKIFDGGNNNE